MSGEESDEQECLGGPVAVVRIDPDAGDPFDGLENGLDAVVDAGVQGEHCVDCGVVGERLDIQGIRLGSHRGEIAGVGVEHRIDGSGVSGQGDGLVIGAGGVDDGVDGGSSDNEAGDGVMRGLDIAVPVDVTNIDGFSGEDLPDDLTVIGSDLSVSVRICEGIGRAVPGVIDEPVDRFEIVAVHYVVSVGVSVYFETVGDVSLPRGVSSGSVCIFVIDDDHGVGSGVEAADIGVEHADELLVELVSEVGSEHVGVQDLGDVRGPGDVGHVLVDDDVVLRIRLHEGVVLSVVLELLLHLVGRGVPDHVQAVVLDYVLRLVLLVGGPFRVVLDLLGVVGEVGQVLGSGCHGVLREIVVGSAHAVRVHREGRLLVLDLRDVVSDDLVVLVVESDDLRRLVGVPGEESDEQECLGGPVAVIRIDPDAGDPLDRLENSLDAVVDAGVQGEHCVDCRVFGKLVHVEGICLGSDGREIVGFLVEVLVH